MPLMLPIYHVTLALMIIFLFALGGCSSASNTLKGFVPANIVDSRENDEIRQAAIEDDSFPSASEPLPKK